MMRPCQLSPVFASALYVQRWKALAPDRIVEGFGFQLWCNEANPDSLSALHARGNLAVLAEVTNQYPGIEPSDPTFDPYLVMAEEVDILVGIHVGTEPQRRFRKQSSTATSERSWKRDSVNASCSDQAR